MGDDIALRRLEALSDIVFGVAITFMAYRLPVPDRGGPAPDWASLVSTIGPHLVALLLSFCIAVIFWLSHHRRLALAPRPGSAALLLNLGFLLLIIFLPITSDLYGTYGSRGDAVGIYAAHLAMISFANFVLWGLAAADRHLLERPRASWRVAAGPGFVAAVFGSATIIAPQHPGAAEYVMFAAFLGPFVSQVVGQVSKRRTAQEP